MAINKKIHSMTSMQLMMMNSHWPDELLKWIFFWKTFLKNFIHLETIKNIFQFSFINDWHIWWLIIFIMLKWIANDQTHRNTDIKEWNFKIWFLFQKTLKNFQENCTFSIMNDEKFRRTEEMSFCFLGNRYLITKTTTTAKSNELMNNIDWIYEKRKIFFLDEKQQ